MDIVVGIVVVSLFLWAYTWCAGSIRLYWSLYLRCWQRQPGYLSNR